MTIKPPPPPENWEPDLYPDELLEEIIRSGEPIPEDVLQDKWDVIEKILDKK